MTMWIFPLIIKYSLDVSEVLVDLYPLGARCFERLKEIIDGNDR